MPTYSYKVHGSGVSSYYQSPDIYVTISWSNPSRPGDDIYINLPVSITLEAMGGSSYFGYSVEVYASLDDSDPEQFLYKPASGPPSYGPNRWSTGEYKGSATLSSTNMTTSATLSLYFKSNCDCYGNTLAKVRSIDIAIPAYVPTYVVSYNANGGTYAPANQIKKENIPLTLSSTPASGKAYLITYHPNEGQMESTTEYKACTFTHWSTNSSGTGTIYNPGSTYTTNSYVTLYAQWKNPTGSNMLPVSKDGYALKGWYTSQGVKVDSNFEITGPLDVYAQWELLSYYNIQYNANGGSNPPQAQQKRSDTPLKLSEETPSPKSYNITLNPSGGSVDPETLQYNCTFKYWTISQSGQGNQYLPGSLYYNNEEVIMYAQWQDPILGDLPVPRKTASTFIGWYDEEGNPVGKNTTINANMTLIARWATLIWRRGADNQWHPVLHPNKFDGQSWVETSVIYDINGGV